MIRVTDRPLLAVSLVAILVVARSGTAVGAETLYARLGGDAGVHAIADTLIDRVAGDPVLGRSFQDTNLARIKRLLAEQICELSDGPCRYSGDPMRASHAGQHISEAEFYGMVSALRQILHERHVSLGAENELLRLLAPMKRDIVEPPSKPGTRPAGTADADPP
jgi:hemoglobin